MQSATSRPLRKLTALGAALAALAFAPNAKADVIPKVLDIGVGLMGQMGGDFLQKPDNKTYTFPDNTTNEDTAYPGFGGFGLGGGLALDVRLFGIVGLEVDYIRSSDRGTGDVTINNQTNEVEIGQAATHIPVLLKGTIPLPVFAPYLLVGPEFVSPDSPEATQSGPLNLNIAAKADSYTMWTFGIGFEFKLPIPSIDLRIPFSLRGSVNPGLESTANDRTVQTKSGNAITQITYKSEWQYQARATLGVMYYF